MPGSDLSNKLLYQITVPSSTEPEQNSDDTWPRSEDFSHDLLYELAVQLSHEEQEERMDTSEPPATLLQPSKCGCTVKTLK